LALGIHGLAMVLLPFDRARDAETPSASPAFEVALDEFLEPPPLEPLAAALEAAPASAEARRDARNSREPALAPRSSSEAPSATPGEIVEPGPSPASEPAPSPGLTGLSNDTLGIGGRNVMLGGMLDGGGGRENGPIGNVAPGIQASISDAIHEHDVDLGLAAGGVLLAPAEDVVRASETPWNSTATIEVTTDAAGEVTSVRVVDVTEAWGVWEHVAADILGAIHGRKIKVRARGHGLVVTLQVASRRSLPSGASPRVEARAGDPKELQRIVRDLVPKPAASAPAAEAPPPAAAARVDLLKPDPKTEAANPKNDSAINIHLPEQRGNAVTALGGTFDLSDIGARPARSVHARVLRERSF